MQLEDAPSNLEEVFSKVLRLLAPGPGNWATTADLVHLKSSYFFPAAFMDPRWEALACKARVIQSVAPDCHAKAKELEALQVNNFRRPFGQWHKNSYFQVLARTSDMLSQRNICSLTISSKVVAGKSFQQVARTMIEKNFQATYYSEARIRSHLTKWRLQGIPGQLDRRVALNMKLLSSWCAPRVQIVYFKAIWNRWTTDARMRTLLEKQGKGIRACLLGCRMADSKDDLKHYAVCDVFWSFLCSPPAGGMGLPRHLRSNDTALLLHQELGDLDRVRLAVALYALYRATNILRHATADEQLDVAALLRLLAIAGARGSPAGKLLRY